MTARFRKKPVEITALQWRGMNHEEVKAFLGGDYVGLSSKHNPRGGSKIMIRTLEGTIYADRGDWIIRGVQGEHYPCKPDIFEATYESADSDAPHANPTQEEMAEGHLFEISMRSWGVSRVVGDPTYRQDDWTLPPKPVYVRGFSLREALEKAAVLPLHVWFDIDEEND